MAKRILVFILGFAVAAGAVFWLTHRTVPSPAPGAPPEAPQESAVAPAASPPAEPDTTPAADVAPSETPAQPLEASMLEDSTWEGDTEQGKISVQLLKDGTIIVVHPFLVQAMGQPSLEGKWRIEDNKIVTETIINGETQTAQILYQDGALVSEDIVLRRTN